jgi:hypothetical protein
MLHNPTGGEEDSEFSFTENSEVRAAHRSLRLNSCPASRLGTSRNISDVSQVPAAQELASVGNPTQDRRRRKEAARAAQMNRRYPGDGDSQREPRVAPRLDSSRASSPRRSAYVPPLRNLECALFPPTSPSLQLHPRVHQHRSSRRRTDVVPSIHNTDVQRQRDHNHRDSERTVCSWF